jgi:hypothetical protein
LSPPLSRTQQEAAANTAHFYSACLAVCSVVVMLSSCPELANGNIGRRPAIYAMVVASFTLSLWLSELWTAAFRPQAIGSTPRIKRFLAVVQWECSDCLLIATDWLSDCLPHQVRFVQWECSDCLLMATDWLSDCLPHQVRFVQWECSDCLLMATDWLSDCLPHQVRFVQWECSDCLLIATDWLSDCLPHQVRFVQWECSDCLLIATDWLSDCLPHQVRFVQWGIVASWTTFRGPFDLTGNGYFFSWAGVAFSAFLLLSSFPQLSGPLERLRDEVGKSPHPPLMHARASLIAR